MITLSTADNALKTFYLDAVTESLDCKANPLLAKIQRSTSDVVGKDVKKLVKYGVNGGISAGTETGALPVSGEADSLTFTASLKNLYGTIEISDKALRASANDEGAFVNLLNDEMKSLIKSASYNFGRMLYGDGTGNLATLVGKIDGKYMVTSVAGIVEGMLVDFITYDGQVLSNVVAAKVTSVDRANNMIEVETKEEVINVGDCTGVYIKGSYQKEITGLKAIF